MRVPPLLLALPLGLPLLACGQGREVPLLPSLEGADPALVERLAEVTGAAQAGDDEALYVLAMLYDAQGFWDLAVEAYAMLPDLEQNARASFHLGRTLSLLGRSEEAAEALRRTTELAPKYGPGWWRLGDALLQVGDLERAREAYERARARSKKDVTGALGVARVALAQGDAEGCVAVLEPLVEANPRLGAANAFLARAYRQLGKEKLAERALRREARSVPAAQLDPWTEEVSAYTVGRHATFKRDLVTKALVRNSGDLPRTAADLGIGLDALERELSLLGIEVEPDGTWKSSGDEEP